MLEREKQQNTGKQGWLDPGKGTGHGGVKRVDTQQTQRDVSIADQQLRREAETPEASEAHLHQIRAAQQRRRDSETPEAREARLHQDYFNLNSRHSFQRPAVEAITNSFFNSM